MAYYKLKNITNLLPKRHINKDSILNVDYNDGFKKEVMKIRVGQEVFISCKNLPINIHKLRMKNQISVSEISKNDFLKKQTPTTQQVTTKKPVDTPVIKEVKAAKKRTYKKKVESAE